MLIPPKPHFFGDISNFWNPFCSAWFGAAPGSGPEGFLRPPRGRVARDGGHPRGRRQVGRSCEGRGRRRGHCARLRVDAAAAEPAGRLGKDLDFGFLVAPSHPVPDLFRSFEC